MSDHIERLGAEEERAARLTAFALGELNEHEQAELEAETARQSSADDAASATAGLSSSADVEQVANALRQVDRSEALPEPSARLRELVESKLADNEAAVGLKKSGWSDNPQRRVWIMLATGLSLLLLAIPVRHFFSNSSSRDMQAEIAQLQADNERLREKQRDADDRLALIQVPRASALATDKSDEKGLKLLVTPGIIVKEEGTLREEVRVAQQDREAKVAEFDSNMKASKDAVSSPLASMDSVAYPTGQQPATTSVAPPNATPYYVTPPASHNVAGVEIVRGSQALGMQGVPAPTQLASGPTARGSGYGAAEAKPGSGAADMYGGAMMGGMPGFAEGMGMYGGIDENGVEMYGEPLAQTRGLQKHIGDLVATESEFSRLYSLAPGASAEQYAQVVENRFASVSDAPLSTFSIDVDTASYANARRFLSQNQLPPPNAIRLEEFINYFSYDYPAPKEGEPFSVNMEVAECPWQPAHQLVRIGLKGKEVPQERRPASNIVFLLDVSGSMQDANKLPLLKQAMKLLTDQLTESDRVSIVTYAGNAGLALNTTNGESKQTIRDAIDALNANGSTNGSAGIQLAYEKATESFLKEGANRVILATDGDLNVGVTDDDALVNLIKQKAASGVFLTVLGFGEGNLKDGKLEKLADNGNGMYAYIDSLREARKVLVEQLSGSLVTIAKDVKIKVEFNPAEVAAYRLLGYENRLMSAPDFNNDAKDAGEIGAGHTVTALYEIVPTKIREPLAATAVSLKYQRAITPAEPPKELTDAAKSGELLTLFLRHKQPDANESTLSEFTVANRQRAFDDASPDFRFAAAVASFGMVLRNSEFRGNSSLADIEQIASSAIGNDPQGHRTELLDLVRKASTLPPQRR